MRLVAFATIRDGRAGWLIGREAGEVIEARRAAEVLPALARADRASRAGCWVAGFVAYEAAAGLDACLGVHEPSDLPLLRFGVFGDLEFCPELPGGDGPLELGTWRPDTSVEQYEGAIARIKDLIAAGDTYQVNYTIRLANRLAGEPLALFRRLAEGQASRYAAFLDADDYAICSVSPELFFELQGRRVVSRPMKGTAARGLWYEHDRAMRDGLAASAKDRAENLMILDMVRNDIGRIAELGSVRVSGLFQIEQYPTLFQMTSTVEGRSEAPLAELFAALFPCASITGAPKCRTMQIIRELEPTPRGVYTGAIGYLAPGGAAGRFSVAIRTAVVHKRTGAVEYGVGGGIVWDSLADREYAECRAKAAVLTHRWPAFELLETLLFEPAGGYALLERHLRRLGRSAEYFGFDVAIGEVRAALEELAAGLAGRSRVRLRVDRAGRCATEVRPEPPDEGRTWRLAMAREPVRTDDVFLYHKTTCRKACEQAAGARGDCDDVLLWNERGEVTETTIANIVLELDGRLVTPPVSCGLLPGVMRAHLLAAGQITERPVRLDELARCPRVFLINAVRGRVPATVVARASCP